ncbi:MAG: hypothetical protein RLY35_584 [Bacteroidota bacterium]|jgi:thioredoxin 1
MIELNLENWSQVIENNEAVLVDVYGLACPPCKTIEARLTELEKNHGNKVFFAKIDGPSNLECVAHYGIRAVPTIMYFKSGKLILQETGLKTLQEIQNRIETHLL